MMMRALLSVATIGLALTIGAAGAAAQTAMLRPAIDAVGNSQPPAIEGVAAAPDGADFEGWYGERRPRGRVVIESEAAPSVDIHLGHRRVWAIPR
jgi:hypothetical protein